ncbi:response regulator transcription factor [Parasphingorhabdus sp.]|uniref:response regulator n=1 Tax=Parasphingorhabdus sp. TaxID=2709688 RepID=UPI003266893A
MAHILIADDDALIGEVVFYALEKNGHSVAVVDNGADVLDTILNSRPDIVILDNLMPGMRGIEVLEQMKISATTTDIPVIMLTSQTGRNHVIEAYRAGVSDYMTKPFEPESLVARIDDLIGSCVTPPALSFNLN